MKAIIKSTVNIKETKKKKTTKQTNSGNKSKLRIKKTEATNREKNSKKN